MRYRSLPRLLAILAVLAMIAAACSSDVSSEALPANAAAQTDPEAVDDEPSPPTTAPSTTTTSTTSAAPTTTTLGRSQFAGTTIKIVVKENPTLDLIAAITDEFFTERTGIEVEFITLQGLFLRDIVFDVGGVGEEGFSAVMIDPFEAPQFGAYGWLADLHFFTDDASYDLNGFIPSLVDANRVRGFDELAAVPFYAESSIIMYNQQIMAETGIDFPANPTWQEVADIARQVDDGDITGICLRGLSGWDELGAALTTVVNTFGGTWWEANNDGTPGDAQINQADSGFRAAAEFYLDLAIDAGPNNFAETGFNECLEQFQNGTAAIWYDTTEAPPLLEAADSPIAGNVGYARAPIAETDQSGALWTWGLATLTTALEADASWEFIRWATSPDIVRLMAEHAPGGWSDPAVIGAATRSSHFDIPEFREATEPYGDIVFAELTAADPNNPSTKPRPGTSGIQYVGIPEFQNIGTSCTIEFSDAVTGTISIDEALDNCQAIAQGVAVADR